MFCNTPMRAKESGNAMFYILIAVALLAALTVAVANSGRSSIQSVASERQTLMAGEILDYSDAIKKSVQMLRLRSVTFTRLEFDDPALTGYANAACTTTDCMIFNEAGGGAVYTAPQSDALTAAADWVFVANNEIENIGRTLGTAAGSDLLMVLRPLNKGVCIAINDALSVTNSGTDGDPPEDTGIDITVPFIGATAYSMSVGDEVTAESLGGGHMAACFRDLTAGEYVFYQVLLPR